MKTDILVRMKDTTLYLFQDVETWSDYKDNHETLTVKYKKSKTAKKIPIKDIFKLVLINEIQTIVREYKD